MTTTRKIMLSLLGGVLAASVVCNVVQFTKKEAAAEKKTVEPTAETTPPPASETNAKEFRPLSVNMDLANRQFIVDFPTMLAKPAGDFSGLIKVTPEPKGGVSASIENFFRVRLSGAFEKDTAYQVEVKPGFIPRYPVDNETGDRWSVYDKPVTFNVEYSLAQEAKDDKAKKDYPEQDYLPERYTLNLDSYEPSVSVFFKSSIRSDLKLKEIVQITPDVGNFDVYISDYSGCRMTIKADFKPDTLYKIVLKPQMMPARMVDQEEEIKWRIAKKPFTISFFTPKPEPSMAFVRTNLVYPLNSSVHELPVAVSHAKGSVKVNVRKILPEHYVNCLDEDSFADTYSVQISEGKYPIAKSVANGKMVVGADFQKLGIPRKPGIYRVLMKMYDGEDHQIGGTERKVFYLTDLMPMMTCGKDYHFAVLSLTDSKPVAGVKVKLYSNKRFLITTLTTDANGMASISEADVKKKLSYDEEKLDQVIFEHGEDMAFLDCAEIPTVFDGDPASEGDYAFVTPERDFYKPGEKATVFALLRNGADRNARSGVPVTWQIRYPNGEMFRTVSGVTDSNGFCRSTVEIPADAPTGGYNVMLCEGGNKGFYGNSRFSVAEFTPDTLVMQAKSSRTESELKIDGRAGFYFGAPVVNGQVTADIFAEWEPFKSEKFKDYSFLSAAPGDVPYERYRYDVVKTVTDEAGKFHIQTAIKPLEKVVMPIQFSFRVTARGAASRSVTAVPKAQIKHFADYYVGVKLDSAEEKAVHFSVKAVTPEDKEAETVSGLTAELSRYSWHYVRKFEDNRTQYFWQEKETVVSKSAVTDGKVSFRDMLPGDYRLKITGADSTMLNKYHFWFSSGESGERVSDPTKLYFTLDREKYQPGDTAAITFDSSLNGTGVVFAGDARIRTKQTFDVKKGKNTVRVSVPAVHHSGDYHASITVVGKRDEKDLNFQYQEGIASLKVDQLARKLAVDIQIPKKARPAETVNVKLQLKNAKDQTPASGMIQLWAVDTGVLALSGFKTPNPYEYFFGSYRAPFNVASHLSNLFYVEAFKEKLIGGGAVSGSAGSRFLSDNGETFKTSAAFLLDAVNIPPSGEAVVSVKLPEHTGELTVMAIAANREKVGSSDKKIVMRDAISVQAVLPRVLAPEDKFSFSFEAFNNDLPDGEATWKISDLKGIVSLKNTAQEGKFKLAKGASQVVSDLNFKVAPDVESCSFRLALTLNGKTITEDCKVTVRSALPKQMFVSTKLLKKGESVTISIDKRKDVLELGTPAIMISGALDFLKEYPYGCTEQITAGAFPYLAVKPLVDAGALDPAFGESAESTIANTINELNLRRESGAWYSMWRGSGDIWIDGSFFVWHFLLEAAAAGHTVDDKLKEMIDRDGSSYVQDRRKDVANRAYVTYILSLLRGAKAARYAQVMLSNDMDKVDDYSRFLLAAAMIRGGMAADGMVELKKVLKTPYCDVASGMNTINSIERRLGLALWILSDILPADDPALLSLVNRINTQIRNDGHWGSTQANAWCVLGLARYNAKLGSGAKTAATVKVGDKTTSLTKALRIDNVTDRVTVTNNGDAPVYIRHSEYKTPEKFVPVNNTLKISKVYLNADGKVVTKAEKGELLTVKVEITRPAGVGSLGNLVLVDLLPGGLEIEDPAFKTRFSVKRNVRYDRFENCTERRFDRIIIFGDAYFDKHEVIYHVRAVTPGKFVIPPVQIESMYSPEIRATDRSADVFEVE